MKQQNIRMVLFASLLTGLLMVAMNVAAKGSFAKNTEPVTTPKAVAPISYDWEASRANLLVIGQAVQEYRRSHTVLPVADRRVAADAGLPPSLIMALLETGQPWSVAPARFKVNSFRQVSNPIRSDYNPLYGIGKARAHGPTPGVNEGVWAEVGERMPIVLDVNMYTDHHLMSAGPLRVLVLRLNGEVDEVLFDHPNVTQLVRQ